MKKTKDTNFKFFNKAKKINTIILASILPVFLITFMAIGIFAYSNSKKTINTEIEQKMNHQLKETVNSIQTDLEKHGQIPASISRSVESLGKIMKKDKFVSITQKSISTNEDTFGLGIWFEPYKYDATLKYFSPYAFKENGKPKYSDEYITTQYEYTKEEWYTLGKNTDKVVVWSSAYVDPVTKVAMVTATAPFYDDNNNFIGVTTADMGLAQIQKKISEIKVGNTGKAVLLSGDGTYLAGSSAEKIMKMKIADNPDKDIAEVGKKITKDKNGNAGYKDVDGKKQVYYQAIPETGWIVALVMPERELYASLQSLLIKIIAILLVASVLVIVVVLLFSSYITRNIKRVNDLSFAIAEGDLTKMLEVNNKNELGEMGSNLNKMTNNLRVLVMSTIESLEQVVATSEELTASSDQTQQSAEEISLAIQKVAQGSEEQVVIALDASRIAKEIFTGIEQISQNVQDVTSASLATSTKAEKGNEIINSAIDYMNNISEKVAVSSQVVSVLGDKSTKIGSIVSSITSIAEQTNLLALNAAIEAARAGQQGRGFAVVADEVRKLAEQSAEAAGNISGLIHEIQNEIINAVKAMNNGTLAVDDGIKKVNEAGKSFGDILHDVNYMASEMQDVSAVVEEISAGTHNMLEGVENVSRISSAASGNSQNVAAGSEQQTALMKEVANAAENLTTMAAELQNSMRNFKL
ncbi:methyl-accepting chemotaxis protein [Clostridium bowmanii]|uniref:methyl-accepting chemotaxis protein n=1 Tax=Clostridium bowmanii TaxID=132925 RepID=UPI001C0D0517|nr:methyl-accepting chemotaxis protein [Clostridium bowmanii]MBU3188173.1 methyl-accepting chemotaxis protein [Clostridium bowmanii]MCA1072355.1 methyl-accepting chemotaxis protein [Clostridium bowmanii]